MKRILFVLSFLCSAIMINAQVITVQGIVNDSTGNPVPNVQITISNPTLGIALPIGYATTDANGNYFWLDSLGSAPIFVTGILDVTMLDCNNSVVTQSVTYTPNVLTLSADFTFCVGGSGGGGSSGSCTVIGSGYQDTINPTTFHFVATASGGLAPYMYVWDFGDGNISTVQNPTHTYAQAGIYNASIMIIDATNNCTATYYTAITTGGTGGNCAAQLTYIPDSSNYYVHHFAGTASGGTAPYTYAWDFGDGNTSTVAYPTHTYSQNGSYMACVTITDANGCSATDCLPVLVGGFAPCTAFMTYSADPMNIMIANFSVIGMGGVAPYTYVWDFGNGAISTQNAPTYTYSQSGTYNVCVTITDATGCVATDCNVISINNTTPCVTSFTSSTTGANPLDYTFTSINANNNNTIYLWDFGDGSIDSSNLGIATHTYGQAGTYLACLFEIDMTTGCSASYCDTVVVAGGAACQSYIVYNNVPGSLVVDFFGNSTSNAVSYAWDFGDGNTSTVQNPTHTYNTIVTGPVTYNVTLTTTDANGCSATTVETVYIFVGNGSGTIMGYLWKDTLNFTPADGLVYLIEYDSTAGTLTAIDTVQTQQGLFDFQSVPMGSYLVKAALLSTDPDYANYLPTYYVQSLNWTNGQYIGPTPFGLPAFIDIQLVAGNNPGGPGFIGGLVVSGAGRPINGSVTLVEDILNAEPIEGLSVLLLDVNNNAVTHTTTAADGSYSFNNIAMGTYNVHVEKAGIVTFDATVLVDGSNLSHTDIHFSVHENMITLTGTYAVTNVEDFQVFPNPVQNTANIQLQLNESMDLTMTVTNLMGQEFINQNMSLNAGNNTFPVEMSDLPAGLYLLSLKSGSDVITYKIQKM